MRHLTPHDVMTMFMTLATLLGCAKLAAELMQKIGQPSILGEISVGIFLGPTVLGHRAVNANNFLELAAALNAPVQ